MTTQADDEAVVLVREVSRAVRHRLLLWFGFPVLAIAAILWFSELVRLYGEAETVRMALLGVVGGPLLVMFGRWLLRMWAR
jgi:hypothetical protein